MRKPRHPERSLPKGCLWQKGVLGKREMPELPGTVFDYAQTDVVFLIPAQVEVRRKKRYIFGSENKNKRNQYSF